MLRTALNTLVFLHYVKCILYLLRRASQHEGFLHYVKSTRYLLRYINCPFYFLHAANNTLYLVLYAIGAMCLRYGAPRTTYVSEAALCTLCGVRYVHSTLVCSAVAVLLFAPHVACARPVVPSMCARCTGARTTCAFELHCITWALRKPGMDPGDSERRAHQNLLPAAARPAGAGAAERADYPSCGVPACVAAAPLPQRVSPTLNTLRGMTSYGA